jgi:hypothetical protein
MSLSELQGWLMSDGLRDDIDHLTRRMVVTEIDNFAPEDTPSPTFDWPRLLLADSILARSDNRAHQEAALRVATAAVTLSGRDIIKDAGAVLLGKLSNFRAVVLARERDLLTADLDSRLGMALRIEAQRRQMDQAILIESSGRWLRVNDFQQRFWGHAAEHRGSLPRRLQRPARLSLCSYG